ncbi:AAA family ATPase [Nevskia soli]|jgi:predicted ATPase|uniref:AAA family ATPase n=1 Tax=Nevskia soli TaxID=418856 RepID=UPI0015D9294D|nr:AAA family ATPase [Nevskia soli]
MLTRLKVSGFKNLVDLDVSFGPFTCIAGANGVGKSNLLDAIVFLSALSDRPLIDAALAVRDQGTKTGDIRGLFQHVGDHFGDEMSFDAEMIIPLTGADDLGQPAEASSTFVQYSVTLRRKEDKTARALGSLELVSEELKHITLREAAHHLPFSPSKAWRTRTILNKRRTPKYISTEGSDPDRVINVHQDGGSSGKPQKLKAANLPRTVLSAANSAESPTATLVRREMQAWRLLQLEPSSLREPDGFTAPATLASDGAHLPAALYHLANSADQGGSDPAVVYSEVANRVGQLINDVKSVYVDRDERRQLLTVYVGGRDGTAYPARSLSDGTLRFLALSVLSLDPDPQGVICLEEPENGIHPERIPAMIQLLRDLTTDVENNDVEDGTRALRQVIINTHSPSVVMQVPDDSLLVAELVDAVHDGRRSRVLQLRCLADTWRDKVLGSESISKGQLLAYLNPVSLTGDDTLNGKNGYGSLMNHARQRRVIDREDLQQYKIPFDELAS